MSLMLQRVIRVYVSYVYLVVCQSIARWGEKLVGERRHPKSLKKFFSQFVRWEDEYFETLWEGYGLCLRGLQAMFESATGYVWECYGLCLRGLRLCLRGLWAMFERATGYVWEGYRLCLRGLRLCLRGLRAMFERAKGDIWEGYGRCLRGLSGD